MELKTSNYDLIILGGGASGLFLGASLNLYGGRGLIIEASDTLGKKLLASGGGRCNFTHDGSIKDFIPHYHSLASNPQSFIRSPLYKFNNKSVIEFFDHIGISSYSQDDGRVFPSLNKSVIIRDSLVKKCESNMWSFSLNNKIIEITKNNSGWLLKSICDEYYATKKLVIAVGSPSWKYQDNTNEILNSLKSLDIKVIHPLPTLTTVNIKNFNLKSLSGISFKNATLSLVNYQTKKCFYKNTGDILITETDFSGPLAINSSWIINKLKTEDNEFDLIIELKKGDKGDKNLSDTDFHGINLSLSKAIKNTHIYQKDILDSSVEIIMTKKLHLFLLKL